MAKASSDSRRYLQPAVLARLGSLELRARLLIEGFIGGMHHSPHHGLSIEFADHRQYTQGDDLRHIDWKVFARTDKFYIKEYEQETNLNILLVVDCSESMTYTSGVGEAALFTKHDYATSLAAAVAYLALAQHDSVGLALFDERLRFALRPSNHAHHWQAILRELAGRTGPGKTSIRRVLGELSDRLSSRSLIILISDLFDEPENVLTGLRRLRFRRHDLIVWNLWDEAELTMPLTGPTMFEGLEASGRLLTEPEALRESYLREVRAFQSRLRHACGQIQADYWMFNTSQPLDAPLTSFLATRAARLRQRSSRVLGGR